MGYINININGQARVFVQQAGVVAASATTVTTLAPAQVKPISGAVAVGATVIGVGADAVEQLVRPDMGQTIVNSMGNVLSDQLTNKIPGASVLTNEFIEAVKGSDTTKKIQSEFNQVFGEQK